MDSQYFRIRELLVQMQNILHPMRRFESSLAQEEKDKIYQVLDLICDINEIIIKDEIDKHRKIKNEINNVELESL